MDLSAAVVVDEVDALVVVVVVVEDLVGSFLVGTDVEDLVEVLKVLSFDDVVVTIRTVLLLSASAVEVTVTVATGYLDEQ